MNNDKFNGVGINTNKADYEVEGPDFGAIMDKAVDSKRKELLKNFTKKSSRRLLRSLKTNRVICAKPYFVGLTQIPAVKHPEKMYGTLNRPIWVNVKQPDGSFTQKLEKVKIALKKGLIKTA